MLEMENVKNEEIEKVSGIGFYKAVNQVWEDSPVFRESFNNDKTLMHKSLVKSSLRVRLILMCKSILKGLEK